MKIQHQYIEIRTNLKTEVSHWNDLNIDLEGGGGGGGGYAHLNMTCIYFVK